MNTPEAYIERPKAVLWCNRVWTLPEFVMRLAHPAGFPRNECGEVTLSQAIRLMPTPCRPVGHDGATCDRYPGVAAGHMKGDN